MSRPDRRYLAAAGSAPALSGQPDPLPVDDPGGNVDGVPARLRRALQGHLPRPTPVRLLDGEPQLGLLVRSADRPPSAAAPPAAEDPAEEVVEVDLDPTVVEVRVAGTGEPGIGEPGAAASGTGADALLPVVGHLAEVGTEPVVAAPLLGV